MSILNDPQSCKVKKTVVVTLHNFKQYVTATGLTKVLADDAALRILEQFRKNEKKYGVPYMAKRHASALKRWKGHRSRLRNKFYRRALPLVQRLFI